MVLGVPILKHLTVYRVKYSDFQGIILKVLKTSVASLLQAFVARIFHDTFQGCTHLVSLTQEFKN